MSSSSDLEIRLARVESRLNRARAWNVALVVLLAGFALTAMQTASPKELSVERVTARSFNLVDAEGNHRGYLGEDAMRGPDPTSVSLTLFGPPAGGGKFRAWVGATGTEVRVTDRSGPSEAVVSALGDTVRFDLLSSPYAGGSGRYNVASIVGKSGEGELLLRKLTADPSAAPKTEQLSDEVRVTLTTQTGLIKSSH